MYVHVYSVCGLQRDGGEKLLKFCKFKHDLKDSVPVQSNFKLAFEWVCNCEVIFQTEASVHCYAYNDTVSFSGRQYLSFKQTSLARLGIWSTLVWAYAQSTHWAYAQTPQKMDIERMLKLPKKWTLSVRSMITLSVRSNPHFWGVWAYAQWHIFVEHFNLLLLCLFNTITY